MRVRLLRWNVSLRAATFPLSKLFAVVLIKIPIP